MSYLQIKAELGISKGTLSGWLRDMPLTKERLAELQKSDAVIEKIRLAKEQKRQTRLANVQSSVSRDIGKLSKREFLIAGFFLYWAEGGKTQRYASTLANTDPSMIRAFIKWLALRKVPRSKIKIRLHLYVDMNIRKEILYWSREIGIPQSQFAKPYVKQSQLSDLTYTTRGHGTCNVTVGGRDIAEYISEGLRYISSQY